MGKLLHCAVDKLSTITVQLCWNNLAGPCHQHMHPATHDDKQHTFKYSVLGNFCGTLCMQCTVHPAQVRQQHVAPQAATCRCVAHRCAADALIKCCGPSNPRTTLHCCQPPCCLQRGPVLLRHLVRLPALPQAHERPPALRNSSNFEHTYTKA
jgi:hypothetical protein